LFFNDEALSNYNTNLKVAPPIRSNKSREALIDGIKKGAIDCIATDHAPHSLHEKETTFDCASFGMIGLESCFGVVKRLLVDEENLSLMNLIKLLTTAPRKIMGFNSNLFKVGTEAELVLFDPNKKWAFNERNVYSKSKNSPFYGEKLCGKVMFTISKGRIAEIL